MTVVEPRADVGSWVAVAQLDDLEPDRGRAALVDGVQIALFRLAEDEHVYAIDNRDPFSGVCVLARGIVGDHRGEPKVASPLYKQSFSLLDGRCIDDASVAVAVHKVRVRDGIVELLRPSEQASAAGPSR